MPFSRQLKLSVEGGGRQTKIWADGYSHTYLEDEEHLYNAIQYVNNNHLKHGLPTLNRGLQPSVSIEKAFEPEIIQGGFDIVIANPPYVRQERIKHLKSQLEESYNDFFNSTSDLYTYFYKKSYDILREGGILCFISSNKWMRAKYGEKLRKFLKQNTSIKEIIDFSGYSVFEQTVDTNIILFQKTIPVKDHTLNFVNVKSDVDDVINYQKIYIYDFTVFISYLKVFFLNILINLFFFFIYLKTFLSFIKYNQIFYNTFSYF